MQALIIKEDGKVWYIENFPYKYHFLYPMHPRFITEQGRKAIDSAILVKNQEYAKELILKKIELEGGVFSRVAEQNINTPIEFPDLKVRIENLLCDPPKSIAIIEEEKEESEEEMWNFIIGAFDVKVNIKLLKELKSKYKITKR